MTSVAVPALALLALALMPPPAVAQSGIDVERGFSFIDLWLAATTQGALFRERSVSGEDVSDIVVEAHEGHVAMRGLVDTEEARQAALAAVVGVPGVKSIDNQLRVAPATAPVRRDDDHLARDVAAMLGRTRELAGARIRIRVTAGAVDLAGSVLDLNDWALAGRTARSVAGVRAVDNRLVIERPQLAHDSATERAARMMKRR